MNVIIVVVRNKLIMLGFDKLRDIIKIVLVEILILFIDSLILLFLITLMFACMLIYPFLHLLLLICSFIQWNLLFALLSHHFLLIFLLFLSSCSISIADFLSLHFITHLLDFIEFISPWLSERRHVSLLFIDEVLPVK